MIDPRRQCLIAYNGKYFVRYSVLCVVYVGILIGLGIMLKPDQHSIIQMIIMSGLIVSSTIWLSLTMIVISRSCRFQEAGFVLEETLGDPLISRHEESRGPFSDFSRSFPDV